MAAIAFMLMIVIIYIANRIFYNLISNAKPRFPLFIRIIIGAALAEGAIAAVIFIVYQASQIGLFVMDNQDQRDFEAAWIAACVLVFVIDFSYYESHVKNSSSWFEKLGYKEVNFIFFKINQRAALTYFLFFIILIGYGSIM